MHWSDQETLLLLEGLEVYGESWSDVAEHVGSKSVEECIRHFIRLPVEDRFLDDIGAGVGPDGGAVRGAGVIGGGGGGGGGAPGASGGEPAPFFGQLAGGIFTFGACSFQATHITFFLTHSNCVPGTL